MIDKIAGVCLLDNPFAIDGIYDYRVGPEIADDVRPGVFVTVPFGTANHRRLALVCEVRDHSKYSELKPIVSVCPDKLSLNEEMLGLCAFMKLRMLCSTGDAVRAMIPAAALSRLVTLYAPDLNHSFSDSDERTSSDFVVYDFIRSRGEVSHEALRAQFGALVEARVRRLCARGYVTKRVILKDHVEPTEKLWAAKMTSDELLQLATGERVGEISLTSQKQKAVARYFASLESAQPTEEICRALEITEAPLKSLCEKGVLEICRKRIDRNPYKTAAYAGQTPLSLSGEQAEAVRTLTRLADDAEAKAALLHGVTGSGKTVVMTALIDHLLETGRGVILLLPEIALTPQSVSIFCARYGERVAVIHSGLSAGERYDAYCRIREGRADVVIGTRSAVFSPVKNLGAIIIDEEQEHTYKSDQNPKYHARDIARYRCASNRALMVLASATPSLESYTKAKEGAYTLIKLTQRYGGAKLPRVEIADMRHEAKGGNLSPVGNLLAEQLTRTSAKGEQSILFLNRRGYNHFVSCRSCGEAVTCPSCSVSMTYHTRRGTYAEGDLVCHWCGKRMPLPKICPSCSSEHLSRMGFGTQRVEEELGQLLPDSKIMRMDTDTTAAKFAYDTMLSDFRAHRADVLLGTQMVTKGHDFPDVTLVGVLLADASLYLDDYRAAERTFSMLTQVIGRAGRRGDKEGLAIIQTNNPDSEVISLACRQDYESFYEREIALRRLLVFPPFCDIALITLSSTLESELLHACPLFAKELQSMIEGEYKDVALVTFGPFEAPVYRVDNKYRMRMVLKCKLNRRTLAMLADLICRSSNNMRKITVSIDLNPTNL